MNLRVIENPYFKKLEKAGFTNAQFKRLDALYLQAVSDKTLGHRTIDVDFDEGLAEYAYYKSEYLPPVLRFAIRHVGPNTVMYEVWKEGKGRIMKSGLFDRAYDRLVMEISDLSS
ncbi:MAG: hypothetical protein H6868_00530 [Rhodospirillales bacterium]|nr:hypothetical protein [Rhodospirillales bacterium]